MAQPALRTDFADRLARRGDEVEDVRGLLLAHADPAAGPAEMAWLVAQAVAVACLGDDHLWQDLRLAHRGELGALLRHWFPSLVALNTGDMKWKKFFYRQLCQQAEILICKSPSCAVCSDHAQCFEAPEDAAAAPRRCRCGAAGPPPLTHDRRGSALARVCLSSLYTSKYSECGKPYRPWTGHRSGSR
jgi:nitrogen fixation protein NifQ